MASLLRVSGLHPADVVENPNQNYTSSESEYGHRFGCCRLCCHDETTLRGLFPGGYKDEVLLRKIFECTTVQISYSEDSDALICYGCVGKIDEFYQFREQCRTNDVLQRNWKRRMNRSMEASRSTLIPVNDVKQEQDIEYDYCDIDIDDDQEDPVRFQASSGLEESTLGDESLPGTGMLLDSSISQEKHLNKARSNAAEGCQLLDQMVESSSIFHRFRQNDENNESNQEGGAHCVVRVKQEPDDEDIDDTMYVWNEEESLPTEKQPATPTLLPIIESAFSTAPETAFGDAVVKHRHIQCASGQVYLFREGFLYLRKPSGSGNHVGCGNNAGANASGWRCRKFDCDAALHRNRARQIVSNGIRHNHSREQQPNATDAEVLAFLGESTPKSQFLKPFLLARGVWKPTNFRYVKNVRNGRSIVHDGYRYSKKHARADGTSFWKCRLNGGTCPAGLFLTPRNTIRITGGHNHKRHIARAPRRKLKSPLEYENGGEENGADEAENEESPKLEPVGSDAQEMEEISLSDYLSTHMEESDPSQFQATTSSSEFAQEPAAGSSGAAASKDGAPGTLRQGYNFQIVRNVNQKLRLLFDGHLYVKENQRTDGAIVWRCRRNYDKCSVLAVQHQGGLVEIVGDHSHDHLQERRTNILVEPSGTFAYRLVKIAHNIEQLIYDGHRYQKTATKSDGSSVWRCVRRSTNCKESVVLSADGKVYEMQSQTHPHKPSELPIPDRVVEENRRRHTQPPDLKVPVPGEKGICRKQITKPRPIPIGHVTRVPMEMQRLYSYRIVNNAKGYESLKHGGYRYCKNRVRLDGTIKWLCKMNNKTCGAWFNMEADGSIPSIASVTHNHVPSEDDVLPVPQRMPKTRAASDMPDAKEYPIDERTFAKSEWYFVKNMKNGSSLIHAGYRYTKKGERVDKSSLWRCAYFTRKCKAGIILFPNETIAKADLSEHIHPPKDMDNVEQECETVDMDEEGAREEEEEEDEEEDEQEEVLDMSAIGADTFDLSGGINEDADPEAMMRSLLNTSLGVGDGDPKTDTDPIFLSKEEAGYRLVKNRRQTNSLLFRGYRYSLQGPRANGSVVWLCQMNNKTCKASVRIHPDDRLEVVSVRHNHGRLEEDNEDYEQQQQQQQPADAKYYYSMNRCNRRCVIYDSCRYGNPTKRVDGSCVWRCAMNGGTCLASVLIEANGALTKRPDFRHNHQPLTVLPVRVSGPIESQAATGVPQVRPKEPWNSAKAVIKGNILSWKQYRYRKQTTLSDGTVLWACATSDVCMGRAKVVVQGNQMRIQSSRNHNHDPVLPVGGQQPAPQVSVTKCENPYTLYRAANGSMALVYQQNRFLLKSRRKDGVTSWVCGGTKVPCPVLIYVNAHGELVKVSNTEHTHAPTDVAIAPGMEVLQLDGQQSWDEFVQDYLKNSASASASDDPEALQKLPNNVLRYRNYVYRLALTRDDGIEYWRCCRYQSDECRSMLHCRNNGTELVDNRNNGLRHNHDREALQGSFPPLEELDHDASVCALKLRQGETYSSHGTYGIMRRRGGTKSLVHRDRRYYLAYTLTDGVSVWRCAQRKRCKCPAVIRIGTSGEMLRTDEHRHNHPAEKTNLLDASTDSINGDETQPVKEQSPELPQARPTTVLKTRGRMLESNGTRNFTYEGRHGRTLVSEGYRYCCTWQRKDGTGFYRCLGYGTHACPMKVKICPNGKLYPHRGERHSHPVPESSKRKGSFSVTDTPEPKTAAPLPEPPRRERRTVSSWKSDARACKNYRIVPTLRGTMLQHEGFEYWTHSRLADGSITYRCRLQFKQRCLASVHLEKPSKLLYVRNDLSHNHPETDESYVAAVKTETDQSVNPSEQCSAVPNEAQPKQLSPAKEECTSAVEELEETAVEQAGQEDDDREDDDREDDDQEEDGNKASDQEDDKEGDHAADNAVDRVSGHAGESHVVTKKYTFGKMAPHKRYLIHDKHLYEFEADQPDGSKKYCCHMKAVAKCSASVVLLIPSARLQVPLRLVHEHDPPVADFMKDVKIIGRGSKDFKFIESKNGSKMLLFRGERYQAPRQKSDGSVSWYCYELTSKGRKCYLLQELLPNGRAAPPSERTHDHVSFAEMTERAVEAPPPKAPAADSAKATTHTKMLRNGGFWYEFGRECHDGSVLWLCRRKRTCEASVYRLSDGRILKGLKAEHTHPPEDIPREATVKAVQESSEATNTSVSSTSKSLSKVKPSPKKGEGSLWHAGNRFWFYYMRNDGVEHWRCSKRQKYGCRAGIVRTADGSVEPYNKIPHSHSLEQEDAQGEEKPPPPSEAIVVKDEAKKQNSDTGNLLAKDQKLLLSFEHQNHRLYRRYLPQTGKVIYECPRTHCNFYVTLSELGKVVHTDGAEHNCFKQSSNALTSNRKEPNRETEQSELGLSSCKATGDGGAKNKESDRDRHRTPDTAAKRIRLDPNLTKEEHEEKKEQDGQERITEDDDHHSSVVGERPESHASSSSNSQAGEAMEQDEAGACEELSPPKDNRARSGNREENGFPSDQLEQISDDSLDDMIIEEQFVDAEELIEFSDVTPAAVIEEEAVVTEGCAGSGEKATRLPTVDSGVSK